MLFPRNCSQMLCGMRSCRVWRMRDACWRVADTSQVKWWPCRYGTHEDQMGRCDDIDSLNLGSCGGINRVQATQFSIQLRYMVICLTIHFLAVSTDDTIVPSFLILPECYLLSNQSTIINDCDHPCCGTSLQTRTSSVMTP